MAPAPELLASVLVRRIEALRLKGPSSVRALLVGGVPALAEMAALTWEWVKEIMWLKYSRALIQNDKTRSWAQVGLDAGGYISEYQKPIGCWITDDSEECWRSWCVSEKFCLDSLTHRHEVVLDEKNVLILRSLLDLDDFAREFSRSRVFGSPEHKWRGIYIDWPLVAERFDGVIITPYRWERRLESSFSWYYCWDCASGCIWRASAILEIRLLEVDLGIAVER